MDHFIAFMGEGELAKGENVELGQVTTHDVRHYKELLQGTPSNSDLSNVDEFKINFDIMCLSCSVY